MLQRWDHFAVDPNQGPSGTKGFQFLVPTRLTDSAITAGCLPDLHAGTLRGALRDVLEHRRCKLSNSLPFVSNVVRSCPHRLSRSRPNSAVPGREVIILHRVQLPEAAVRATKGWIGQPSAPGNFGPKSCLGKSGRLRRHVQLPARVPHGRYLSSMDVPLELTNNVSSYARQRVHGAVARFVQIFLRYSLLTIY
jgi:hypothetical protein